MTTLIKQLTTLKKKTLANGGDYLDLDEAQQLFSRLEIVIARLEAKSLTERREYNAAQNKKR